MSIVAACVLLPGLYCSQCPGEYATHGTRGNTIGRFCDALPVGKLGCVSVDRPHCDGRSSILDPPPTPLANSRSLRCRRAASFRLPILYTRLDSRDRRQGLERPSRDNEKSAGQRPSRACPLFINCKETTGIGRLQYCCSCMYCRKQTACTVITSGIGLACH